MTNSSAWFALAGALGGIFLTGGFTLITAALNHRWTSRADREQELRSTKDRVRDVFHDYLIATNAYFHAVDRMHIKALRDEEFDPWEDAREEYKALQEQYQYLTISAGDEVRRLARSYDMVLYGLADAVRDSDEERWSELRSETHKARDRVRVAMRAELGVSD
jgi:hypothetical protein